MTKEFRLMTFRIAGFESVGLGVGADPNEVIDIQRAFNFMHKEKDDRTFLVWPKKLDMLQIMENWDIFNEKLKELVQLKEDKVIPSVNECDFVYNLSDVTLAPPIPNPKKTLAAGGNYYDHMHEMGVVGDDTVDPAEDRPFIFVVTPDNTLIGNDETIVLPKEKHWDRPGDTPAEDIVVWETELAVVMSRAAKDISPEEALDYIAGYTIYQDLTAETVTTRGAFEMDWFTSKSGDTFSPMGPWITPKEFVKDPQELKIKTTVNDDVKQNSSTNQMMHSVANMISYASSISKLQPGDVVTTGTCAGQGMAHNIHKLDPEKVMAEAPKGLHYGSAMLLANTKAGNAQHLHDGDVLVSEVEGLGKLSNPVVYPKE